MKYSDVIALLSETGLSPELLAGQVSVSNSTYRRWLKASPRAQFPKEYESGLAEGIYKLLNNKSLSYDSGRVNAFMENNLPAYFQAAIGQVSNASDLYSEHSTHQEKITTMLSSLGNSTKIRDRVDKSSKTIMGFVKWGASWKQRVQMLSRVIHDRKLLLVDKLIAYGALFYLILPFDLIPDSIPVFGYVDDFGILGFAAAYYVQKFPGLSNDKQ